MLGRYASNYALILARWCARIVRPLERVGLSSLHLFMTPRGPMLFAAFSLLLIGALAALIALAPGPGSAAWIKLGLGLTAFALFAGYLRAYFATRSEVEALLAGLRGSTAPDAARPRGASVLSSFDFGLFLLGLATAHTAVAAGLLDGGFGPQAFDASGAAATPAGSDWLIYALWASLGALDPLALLPRPDEHLLTLRYEWGWTVVWLYAYRLIMLGALFSVASRAFEARRKTAVALDAPGLWPEKQAHLERLGRSGFLALSASLSDPDAERREDAARMLGALKTFPAEAAEALVAALGDPSETVRERVAESLGALGLAATEATPALTGRLLDSSHGVRRQAAQALGAVAVDRLDLALPAMAALASAIPEDPAQLETADARTLAAVAGSLAAIASTIGDASEQAVAAVDRLRGHREPQVRQTASEAYGRMIGAAQSKAQAEAQRQAELAAAEREAEWARGDWPPRHEWTR